LLQTGDLGQRNVFGHVGLAGRLALAVDDLPPEEAVTNGAEREQ
jgi:hypothetical protein